MIKQIVSIANFNSLYEILDEIKENLAFDITKYEGDKNKFINTLIITNSNEKSFTEKNVLIFNDLPMSLIRLIELININLIKLKFNHQSKININGYELNINSKFFSKDNIYLKLTEKEIEIILYLNQKKLSIMFLIYKRISGDIHQI